MDPIEIYSQIQPMVKKEIDDKIAKEENDSQFKVVDIPAHTHTGVESMKISYGDLEDRLIVVNTSIPGTQASTAGNYGIIFTAPFDMTVKSVSEVHSVKGTDGGSVLLGIDRLRGTTAPYGTAVAVLSGGNTINLKGNNNTVVYPAITNDHLGYQLNTGDRLAFNLTGTPTSVQNVNLVIILTY